MSFCYMVVIIILSSLLFFYFFLFLFFPFSLISIGSASNLDCSHSINKSTFLLLSTVVAGNQFEAPETA